MKTNEFGEELDANGYAPSIVQDVTDCYCFLCGRTQAPLNRHEIIHGTAYRTKSKNLGIWVTLCKKHHDDIHRGTYNDNKLRQQAQMAAQFTYGWSRAEWVRRFGKNYID